MHLLDVDLRLAERAEVLRRLHGSRPSVLPNAWDVASAAAPFSMSLEAASKHVRVLERAGLVRRTVDGRRHICSLSPAPLAAASAWLRFYERFWNGRLDALGKLFATRPTKKGKKR